MLSDEENREVDDDFHINTTISLLWFCTALLSLPTLVVWSTSTQYYFIKIFVLNIINCLSPHPFLRYSLTLPNDYFLVPSFVWSISGMMILQKSKAVNDRLVFIRLKFCFIRLKYPHDK